MIVSESIHLNPLSLFYKTLFDGSICFIVQYSSYILKLAQEKRCRLHVNIAFC